MSDLLEQDCVLLSKTDAGAAVLNFPITRANCVEGVGRNPGTAYSVGDVVACDGSVKHLLLCTASGTTAETDLNIANKAAGEAITDGSVTWEVIDRRITFDNLPNKPTTLAGYGITDGVKTVNNRLPDSNGNVDLTMPENNDFIGMRIEGGGTIFFDYALGYQYGSLSVAPVTENLHSYHVDKDRNVVVCDDPDDTTKKARFYVVSDYDIGDYKHGNCLMWADAGASHLYNVNVGTSTAFGAGYANTEKCIAAASKDGRIEWNSNAYACIWHYVSKGDWTARSPKWFVPSKDELNVLLNMQWQEADRRKSYDGNITFKQLPINFYSYYWSSSESSTTVAHYANFYNGDMGTGNKNVASGTHVPLVKTF